MTRKPVDQCKTMATNVGYDIEYTTNNAYMTTPSLLPLPQWLGL